mmetsp:Transcript_165496/g.531050  ORF Transcript_165496/g.531050 Transcript_165496/m.531050 type:complete len:337 (-) Transcript_165496:290-1300(-)
MFRSHAACETQNEVGLEETAGWPAEVPFPAARAPPSSILVYCRRRLLGCRAGHCLPGRSRERRVWFDGSLPDGQAPGPPGLCPPLPRLRPPRRRAAARERALGCGRGGRQRPPQGAAPLRAAARRRDRARPCRIRALHFALFRLRPEWRWGTRRPPVRAAALCGFPLRVGVAAPPLVGGEVRVLRHGLGGRPANRQPAGALPRVLPLPGALGRLQRGAQVHHRLRLYDVLRLRPCLRRPHPALPLCLELASDPCEGVRQQRGHLLPQVGCPLRSLVPGLASDGAALPSCPRPLRVVDHKPRRQWVYDGRSVCCTGHRVVARKHKILPQVACAHAQR